MRGLDPRIPFPTLASRQVDGFISSPGVTGDIARRAWEHRDGALKGFTREYRLKRVVYAEFHEDIRVALQREKNMKHWKRIWKIDPIQSINPTWSDLYETLV